MSEKTLRSERARAFRELHGEGSRLVLPNVWDAGSARLVESCGATAVATSSAAVAWAHGTLARAWNVHDALRRPGAVGRAERAVLAGARLLLSPRAPDGSSKPR
jgi:hypothetical protein